MAVASLVNLWRALPTNASGVRTMVTREGFTRMATIFVPALVYVGAIHVIGIYVPPPFISLALLPRRQVLDPEIGSGGRAISLISFLMFEVWFLVPLPKGR